MHIIKYLNYKKGEFDCPNINLDKVCGTILFNIEMKKTIFMNL